MPQTEVVLYQEEDGRVPLVDWLDALPDEARDRCLARLALLEEKGHELRRPHAENLGGGLYELRIKCYRVNYRIRALARECHATLVAVDETLFLGF
jgi:phage-related protein